MVSIFSEVFKQQQANEDERERVILRTQIRNAIIQIEDGEIDDAIATLQALIGESPVGDEVQP
jgi:hypothetical protein